MTSIRLPKELNTRLENLASITYGAKSFYICEALQQYIDDLEGGYIALERIANPKQSKYTIGYTHSKGRLCQALTSSITPSVILLINDSLISASYNSWSCCLISERLIPLAYKDSRVWANDCVNFL